MTVPQDTVETLKRLMREHERRTNRDRWVPAERAIQDAVDIIEAMPADERLTRAVILLGEARDVVADFVDSRQPPAAEPELRCTVCGDPAITGLCIAHASRAAVPRRAPRTAPLAAAPSACWVCHQPLDGEPRWLNGHWHAGAMRASQPAAVAPASEPVCTCLEIDPSCPVHALRAPVAVAETAGRPDLLALLDELATDLEDEIRDRYGEDVHPALRPKYERDMDAVRRARAALAAPQPSVAETAGRALIRKALVAATKNCPHAATPCTFCDLYGEAIAALAAPAPAAPPAEP